jgi:hypothetical protein
MPTHCQTGPGLALMYVLQAGAMLGHKCTPESYTTKLFLIAAHPGLTDAWHRLSGSKQFVTAILL